MAHRRPPLALALGLNTAVTVVELATGVGSNSLSLIMDGVHNVSDEVALALLVLAYTLRTGLSGRFLRWANLFNSGGLLVISGLLTWQVVGRTAHPQTLLGVVSLIVGLLGAGGNAGVAVAVCVMRRVVTEIRC